MSPASTLALSGLMHDELRTHLFPGDGKEAASILICARSPGPRRRLVVRDAILVPYDACRVRKHDFIAWPGRYLEEAIDLAEPENLVVVLLHSHPGGWLDFSSVDNDSDASVLPSLFQAFGDCHGSAIMTPDGAIRARLYTRDMTIMPVDLVTSGGDDIKYWWNESISNGKPSKRPLPFGGDMKAEMSQLSATVIGVSGTGSIVAEQVARLGFGKVTLIDHDVVEFKNLNRILNSTLVHAQQEIAKVAMFAGAVEAHRGPKIAVPVARTIACREAVEAAAQCDVLFSCVDTQEARQIADLIAAAFLIPLFDVGVVIPTRATRSGPAISDVCGRIDYVQPGGSSLADRKVYTPEGLRAEHVRMTDPEAFNNELAEGYIKGVLEEAPGVITLNMRAASAVVNEFIARAYPYRHEPNALYARTTFSLAACEEDHTAESAFSAEKSDILGRGDAEPLLGLPLLRRPRKVAA